MKTFETKHKTFTKSTASQVKELIPGVAKSKQYGSKMNQVINFYDKEDRHLGYFSNEGKRKGTIRVL